MQSVLEMKKIMVGVIGSTPSDRIKAIMEKLKKIARESGVEVVLPHKQFRLPMNREKFIEQSGYIDRSSTLNNCACCDWSVERVKFRRVSLTCSFYGHLVFSVKMVGWCKRFEG